MPVPDKVIFGPAHPTGQLNYGAIRKLKGDDRLKALKGRLDRFLIEQTNELGKAEAGSSKVYSPFPLFLLTCVAIETLGKALHRPKDVSDDDAQRTGFLTICGKLDKKFSRQLAKKDKKGYDNLWGDDEHKKVKSIANIIYRFGRHTMAHGFRGKGVYLTESIPEWDFSDGALVLNPYWFWRAFRSVYDNEWIELFEDKEPKNSRKRSAEDYIAEILN